MRAARVLLVAAAAAGVAAVAMGTASCRRSGPDWRVLHLYGGAASIALLERAPKVEACLLAPPGAKPARDERHAGPFAARGTPVELTAEAVAELRAVLLSADSYDWHHAKRAAYRPQIGLWFADGASVLSVALDLETSQITAYAGEQTLGAEDVDEVRTRLIALAARLFPNDGTISALR